MLLVSLELKNHMVRSSSTSEHTQSHFKCCNYVFNEIPEALVGKNTEKPSFTAIAFKPELF